MRNAMRNLWRRWFETPEERRCAGALVVATIVHLALLVALFLVVLDAVAPTDDRPLDSAWAAADPEVDVTPVVIAPPTAEEANPHAGGSTARALMVHAESMAPPRVAVSMRSTTTGKLPVAAVSPGASLLASVSTPTGGEALFGAGSGEGRGDGIGNGDDGGFFGLSSPGRTFVYVVDASSSMYARHDSEAKTRFGRVQVELVKSIGNMTPQQGFFVLFFNSVPHPMPARGLQPALPEIKQQSLEWVARHRAGGDTNPVAALEIALALQPDVIYFLTDGVLPRGQNVIRRITSLNRGRVRVHTFAFGSRTGEKLMRELASRNNGEYHFVP